MAADDVTNPDMASAGADMTSAEATAVATSKTSVTSSSADVTTAMLCPQGYGQGERERRDGYQATHTATFRL